MIYVEYIIKDRDTLQSIAHTQLGDVTQWTLLKDFNNLRYPYLVTDKEKRSDPIHLLSVGDTLMIPIAENLEDVNPETLPQANQNRIYDMALGMDIKLGRSVFNSYYPENGGSDDLLEMLTSTDNRDIDTVQGTANLVQSLRLRLLTARGSLMYHPDYGSLIDTYLGQKLTDSLASALDIEIENTIRRDSRVSDVVAGTHYIKGNMYGNSFTVTPISLQQAFQLVINGNRVSGISVSLGGENVAV